MGEWRDISSAPRDGSLVLLWATSFMEPYLGRWDHGGWRNNHYGSREPYWMFSDVTHWQSLPDPPKPEARDASR